MKIASLTMCALLLLGLWHVAGKLHAMKFGVTAASEIARHWVLAIGLFTALLSPWPQSLGIAAIAAAVYLALGAMLRRRQPVVQHQMPQELHRSEWSHVSGGMIIPPSGDK